MKTGAMILGLIGAVLGLPGAVCSGACAAGLTSFSSHGAAQSQEIGHFYMGAGLIGALMALVGAIVVMSNSKVGGAMLLVAFLLVGLSCITMSPLSILVALLLLIAAILGLAAPNAKPSPANVDLGKA